MRTTATSTLKATMLFVALVTLAVTGLPRFAIAADSEDCSPAVCISPVMGPGNHLAIET